MNEIQSVSNAGPGISQEDECVKEIHQSNGAERMRRHRHRKRQGVVCVVQVPIYVLDMEMLVKGKRLAPEDESNTAKIAAAVEALVDDFTEGKLVPAGDG